MNFCCNVDGTAFSQKPTGWEIGGIKNRLAGCRVSVSGVELEQAIREGRSFTAGELAGTTADTWQSQQLLVADIDNTDRDHKPLPPEQQLTPIGAIAAMKSKGIAPYILYSTFSDTSEHQRFRVICCLSEPVTDARRMELLNLTFQSIFPGSDAACKNLDRLYFGGRPDCIILHCTGKLTEVDTLLRLAATMPEQLKEPEKREEPEKLEKPIAAPAQKAPRVTACMPDQPAYDDDLLLAREALSAIAPDRLSYQEWYAVISAAKAAGLSVQEVDAWSAGGARYQPREITGQWHRLNDRHGYTMGTLIYHAEQQGWPAPKRKRTSQAAEPEANCSPASPDSAGSPVQLQEDAGLTSANEPAMIPFEEIYDGAGTNQKLVLAAVQKLAPRQNPRYMVADDIAAGRLFSDLFGSIARYNTTTKCWWIYDGVIWKADQEEMAVDHLAKMLAKALYQYTSDLSSRSRFRRFAVNLGKRSSRERQLKDARSFRYFRSEDLDAHPTLLNTRNCVIDLTTGARLDHDPALLLSMVTGCDYLPDAPRDEIDRFIDAVMEQDAEKIVYLQKLLGYTLLGECGQEEMYLFYGPTTRNGKSTLCDAMETMMGSYAMHCQPETLAAKQNKDGRTASGDIARLAGIRYLHCSEPPKNMRFDEALLKTMTGRDPITARNLFEREFQFVPVFKLIVNTNHLPSVSDDTLFGSERVRVLEFRHHFSEDEQDIHLKDRLKEPENLSALLNWCLEGLWLYHESDDTLEMPSAVRAATDAYREESDKLGTFISDCLIPTDCYFTTLGAVYPRYQDWCRDNGLGAEGKRNFTKGLRTKGILKPRMKVRGKEYINVIEGYMLEGGLFAQGNIAV